MYYIYLQKANKKNSDLKKILKIKRSLNLFTFLVFTSYIALQPISLINLNKKVSASENPVETAVIGVSKLTDPDYYPEVNLGTDNLTTQEVTLPAKTETLDKAYYGFFITVDKNSEFENFSFKVLFKDGDLSKQYILEADDITYGEKKIDPNISLNSNSYIFTQGITEIQFFYNGEKKFTTHKIEFPTTDKKPNTATDKTIKTTEYASTTVEKDYKEKLFASLGFNIVTREEWGAPTTSPWAPTIADINRIVVHHTATSVDMNNPSNTVKAIYNSHYYRCSNNNGSYNSSNPDPACDEPSEWWEDIGYNYLIDPYGNIYEGRAGGNGVVGAHAPPNTGSIGISLLGNYVSQEPTTASMQSLTKLISVLAQLNNFNLSWGTSVLGHKDLAATSCPGAKVYAKLPTITSLASQMIGQNPQLSQTDRIRDQMLSDGDYQKVNGEVELIVDTSEVTDTLKDKLETKSRGVTSVKTVDNKLLYTVPTNKTDQLIAETLMVDGKTKIQPNFIYKMQSWDNSSSTRSIPSDYDVTTHWTAEKINLPEAWKTLGGCTSDNTCGGSQSVVVAVIDSGVAYEDYDYDAGGTYTNNNYSGLFIQTPTSSTPNGTFNEGYDREYRKSPVLNNVNFVNPTDIGQSYLCALRALDANTAKHCNATETTKINHANDDQGHGTFISAIIAGDTGDDAPDKIIGIAHNISIMPIKALLPNDTSMCQNSSGELDLTCSNSNYDYRSVGNSYTLATAIDYARTHGADIMNISLTGPGTDPLVQNAITNASNTGITVIVSAGNDNANIANYFPASFSNVITVGASNSDNTRSNYSNYGSELDLVAPVGQSGQSRIASQTYSCFGDPCSDETNANLFKTFTSSTTPAVGSGTSFAAPQVAAAAALALSVKPTLTRSQIYNLIVGTTTELVSGFNQYTGYGLLNINEVVKNVNNIPTLPNNTSVFSTNGDNYTDIVAFNTSSHQIDVTLSNGSSFGGGWHGYQIWNSNTGYSDPTWKLLEPADVNGDGNIDLIAFNTQTNQVDVTLSNGANFGGGYKGFQVWNSRSGYSTSSWQLLDPADVNGDKMADLIAFNPTTRSIDVTLSTGSNFGGGYKGYQVWNSNTGYNPNDWSLLPLADVNGDGLADIIARNKKDNKIDVTLSTGSNFGGGYKGYQIWNSSSGYSYSSWVLFPPADVNGDSMADIIAYNKYSTQIDVTLSTGSNFGGGYKGYQVWNSNTGYDYSSWKFLDPSDVNGDNLADIIAFNKGNTAIYVTLSTGSNFGGGWYGYQSWNTSSGYSTKSWQLLN